MSAACATPATLPAAVRPRTAAPLRRAVSVALPAQAPRAAAAGWLERLALWAEAQPAHRRLGSWTVDT